MNKKSFILIGQSGCGKGTQGENLRGYLHEKDPSRSVFYLQTGAEFREFIKRESATAHLSKKVYDVGGLQPEFLAIHMWSNLLAKNYNGVDHLIADGTPRKYHEAGVLDSMFDFYGFEKPHLIYLKIGKQWAHERLLARGRIDDNPTDIAVRIAWFETDVIPTLEYYRKNSRYILSEVNGEQPIEAVWKDIQAVLGF